MPPSPSTQALLGSGTGTAEPTISYTVVVRYVSVFIVVWYNVHEGEHHCVNVLTAGNSS